MRIINKLGIGVAAVSLMLSSCTKNFEELNTNPSVSPSADPKDLIVSAEYKIVDRDFEWFYDNYTYIMRWMQFVSSNPTGTYPAIFVVPTNSNYLYRDFYVNVGRYTSQIQAVVGELPETEKAKYQNVVAIAKILQAYTAWRMSDNNGSIPYTEALSARTGGTFTPKYDSQSELFGVWDAEVKAAVATLAANAANQVSYGTSDIFYSGDAAKWAKAGNALRLKMAMRQYKRTPAKTSEIVTDVLASPAGLFTSNAEEWKFISASTTFARGGNWNPDNGSGFVAPKNMVDFMYENSDPRIRIFYQENSYRQTLIDSLVTGGGLSAGTTYNPRRYVGAPSSQDARNNAAYAQLFRAKTYNITIGGKASTVTVDTVSRVQTRLFDLDQAAGAQNGAKYTQPIITYAEVCFMMAELVERGITSGDAADWYNKGVTASIQAYDAMGNLAQVLDYTAVAPAEITAYLSAADIAYTGTQEEKLEKIAVQNFVNLFKAPHEAWGSWKRTGYPKEGSTILPLEPFFTSGVKNTIPRRWVLPVPTNAQDNIPNYNAAIAAMKAEGAYGEANDVTGRVWWDFQ
ncbi:SusD/RagB family nutrient-binding outer membrane lipoprotein [Chitinophaga tropicalis]|uniref:SusD/RagB family nutrient-binding outer membrane lipoprotein n=1 Tax=Chitinophaga tropicalis TaxID=2683588 RepID=A0A7K1UBJ4_9BACT|nr:SusD/RagB family nutrient-binding outer membrane lipoprotein [Chitinophaga tropicalis]MVT11762.1 SusD/RagB family nutrient-binding outer membrane lipoprotein [Chitinophaga tropicalis]